MERSLKYNELTSELKERNLLIAELQTTVETQKKLIADTDSTIDGIYFETFKHGSVLLWLGEDYNRVMAKIYHRETSSLASSSGALETPL